MASEMNKYRKWMKYTAAEYGMTKDGNFIIKDDFITKLQTQKRLIDWR